MQFRVVTLNLEQDHKRWSDRHPLISAEIAGLRPDVIAFNEVCVPLQTARLLRDAAIAATGIPYKLVQQTRVNGLSKVEGEALLTRFAVVETGNLDYQTRDIVALVARVVIEERPVDFYVTHLYMSRGDDSLRLFQVQQLLQWIDSRADGTPAIVCGDFNATLDASSAGLMATRFRPTQTLPTAFTPLADQNGAVSHPYWPRMDRCIDYIWISDGIGTGTLRYVHCCRTDVMWPRPVWSPFVTWTNADARLVWVRPGRLGAIATEQVLSQQRKCRPTHVTAESCQVPTFIEAPPQPPQSTQNGHPSRNRQRSQMTLRRVARIAARRRVWLISPLPPPSAGPTGTARGARRSAGSWRPGSRQR
jgi:endonuclease/exonuclease/phosphatase family metal-dependent hydrolase